MNRVQFWLLLLLGIILLGTAAFWIFDRSPATLLANTTGATVADSPVQITDIARRRPNMLLISGKGPANTVLNLRLSGNKVGNTTTDASGAFQLTTGPLPRDEDLNLSLEYGAGEPLNLLVIDRHPQLIALATVNGRTQPLQRPRTGNGILLVEWLDPPTDLRLIGQAVTGATIYAYADNTLVGKTVAMDNNASIPSLFTLELDEKKFPVSNSGQNKIRIDMMDKSGKLIARVALNLNDSKVWQQFKFADADNSSYIWRDLDAQQADVSQTYPGQFVPIAAPQAITNQ